MPIRKVNRAYYEGPEYAEFRAFLRARAGDRCEQCRAKNGVEYFWTWSEYDTSFESSLYWDNNTWITPGGLAVDGELLRRNASVLLDGPNLKYCRVLTVQCGASHTDHDPRPRDPERARWLCARCHLAHDQSNNIARKRRLRAAAQGQLWLCADVEKADVPEGLGK